MPSTKALVVFSGGLDSLLAAKVLEEQGIRVELLSFESDFFGAAKARDRAAQQNWPISVIEIREKMLDLVKNPPHGYGKNLNPCIDCHGLMFRLAGEHARRHGFDLIASGEVLGQRPFSQTKEALARVEKLAGRPVLRPLSAKLLPETEMEKSGLVIRGRLKDLSGRRRERQFELAARYGIKNIPSPAGGCLLTDPAFCERLLRLLEYWPACSLADVALLKHGRADWLEAESGEKILYIIGRHQDDNDNLEALAQIGDYMLELIEVNGPLTLVRGAGALSKDKFLEIEVEVPEKLERSSLNLGAPKSIADILEIVSLLTAHYAVKARKQKVRMSIKKQ